MRKVIVTGGRNYADFRRVSQVLDLLNPMIVVHGGAAGADALAGRWATVHGAGEDIVRAEWDLHGRAAGPIRNEKMLRANLDAVAVVAFPGGAGTQNCVRKAVELGFCVLQVL